MLELYILWRKKQRFLVSFIFIKLLYFLRRHTFFIIAIKKVCKKNSSQMQTQRPVASLWKNYLSHFVRTHLCDSLQFDYIYYFKFRECLVCIWQCIIEMANNGRFHITEWRNYSKEHQYSLTMKGQSTMGFWVLSFAKSKGSFWTWYSKSKAQSTRW